MRPEATPMDFLIRPQSKIDPDEVRARAKQVSQDQRRVKVEHTLTINYFLTDRTKHHQEYHLKHLCSCSCTSLAESHFVNKTTVVVALYV